jgi:hypothetical protein
MRVEFGNKKKWFRIHSLFIQDMNVGSGLICPLQSPAPFLEFSLQKCAFYSVGLLQSLLIRLENPSLDYQSSRNDSSSRAKKKNCSKRPTDAGVALDNNTFMNNDVDTTKQSILRIGITYVPTFYPRGWVEHL